MAPIRSSNIERGKWRSKCREQLSQHIRKAFPAFSSIMTNIILESRIGVSIELSQVRLALGPDDPYSWKVLPEKKHLFLKNISDYSTGVYKELYKGVGVLFEAIATKPTGTKSENITYVFTEVYKYFK